MKRITLIISMTAFLAACNGSGGSGSADGVDSAIPDLGSALTDPVDTASLEVSEDFAFDTARSIDIAFDIEQARGKDASVSICSKYAKDGDAFDVDYDSCTVQGNLVDGVFNHSVEVTNEFESVVGVVWFQDENTAPLYKEFFVDAELRMKGDGTKQRRIVWK